MNSDALTHLLDNYRRAARTGRDMGTMFERLFAGSRICKKDIDSFMAASGREPFRRRVIIDSTEDPWSASAETMLRGQAIPTFFLRSHRNGACVRYGLDTVGGRKSGDGRAGTWTGTNPNF
ncbi:MAG: hypothetical protein GDA39_04605 [Hyphomonadaceae bacterium]|nr:hypothetical protein [Hyphomonadaceae bacterium]MBC6412206.1 hypothetical protein [Hyphomonadaceae bacterium]